MGMKTGFRLVLEAGEKFVDQEFAGRLGTDRGGGIPGGFEMRDDPLQAGDGLAQGLFEFAGLAMGFLQ